MSSWLNFEIELTKIFALNQIWPRTFETFQVVTYSESEGWNIFLYIQNSEKFQNFSFEPKYADFHEYALYMIFQNFHEYALYTIFQNFHEYLINVN